MKENITLEIAVDGESEAYAAASAGADRLELCADLAGHGYTPQIALVRAAASIPGVRTVAMLRPRGLKPAAAGFVYDAEDWALILREAEALLAAGAGGLVFGCLSDDGRVQTSQVRELISLAAGRETVFHRAIDLTGDPGGECIRLAGLGLRRILTSGMSLARTANELGVTSGVPTGHAGAGWQAGGDEWDRRMERVAHLVSEVGMRLEVLPGVGIRAANVADLISRTGCRQVHSSARIGGRFDPLAVAGLRAAVDAAR